MKNFIYFHDNQVLIESDTHLLADEVPVGTYMFITRFKEWAHVQPLDPAIKDLPGINERLKKHQFKATRAEDVPKVYLGWLLLL